MKPWLGLHGTVLASPAPPLFTRSPSDDAAHTGRPTAVEIIGLDRRKRASQRSINADDGTITDRRIATHRERFTAVLGERPRARILLEASTESEWVARHLESLGHEVIVADPNYAPMYANRSRRTKTDKRDALVRTRTRYIALAKALVRRDGLRVPTSSSAWVPTRIEELDLSPTLTTELAPLFAVFAPLNAQIGVADARIAALVQEEPIAMRLTTAPGVGPVTASAFVATIDDITRFHSAHELEAYLWVIPSERSSGEAAARAHHEGGQWAHAHHRRRGIVGAVRSFVPPSCAPTFASHMRARTEG